MVLLVIALALIIGAGIIRLDLAGIPTWLRAILMTLVLIIVAAGTVYALGIA